MSVRPHRVRRVCVGGVDLLLGGDRRWAGVIVMVIVPMGGWASANFNIWCIDKQRKHRDIEG